MFSKLSPHSRALLLALLVTFLWSTSWVLIKIGLEDIPALPFAGLRYTLAFLFLLPFTLRSSDRAALRQLSRRTWLQLLFLGLLFYAVTQGAQFLGLFYLPAITVNLMLSFTTILVALLGIATLGERLTSLQWGGTGLYLAGALIYFYPATFPAGQALGLVIVVFGVIANASSSILGRHINRSLALAPRVITLVSMGIGAAILLIAGLAAQGAPRLDLTGWSIILWLAVVNSAFAFTLWNRTLRTLSAIESSIVNNTMMIQIPVLAWLFLGEQPTGRQIIGMILAGAGIVIVQLRRRRPEIETLSGPADQG